MLNKILKVTGDASVAKKIRKTSDRAAGHQIRNKIRFEIKEYDNWTTQSSICVESLLNHAIKKHK